MARSWRSQIADEVRACSMMKPNWTPNDWPEDFEHENGNYSCICHKCGGSFIGHKRRVTCKVCSESKEADQ